MAKKKAATPKAPKAPKPPKTKLKVEKRPDGWWITGAPLEMDNGPYVTKDEANEDRAGLERFFDVEVHRKPNKAA